MRRAAPLLVVLAVAVLLAACGEAPAPRVPGAPQVTRTFVAGEGYARPGASTTSTAAFGREPSPPRAECDLQNSTLQDSGLPVLLMEPLSPRPGETVTVTGERLPPGPRRLTLMTPLQRDHQVDVTVGLDGRLRATFAMPPVVAGRCAMLLLDGSGVQSLGFAVRE